MKFYRDEIIFYSFFALSGLGIVLSVLGMLWTKNNDLTIDNIEVQQVLKKNRESSNDEEKRKKIEADIKERVRECNEELLKIGLPKGFTERFTPGIIGLSRLNITVHTRLLENFTILGLSQYITINIIIGKKINYEAVKKRFFADPKFEKFAGDTKSKMVELEAEYKQKHSEEHELFSALYPQMV